MGLSSSLVSFFLLGLFVELVDVSWNLTISFVLFRLGILFRGRRLHIKNYGVEVSFDVIDFFALTHSIQFICSGYSRLV